ncbi:MAG: Sec-independent protein translocase subunit TatA [Longispora sp.]|nr:Sec-independent protein translocase subunit TatA [Longispora sp. (in: high G+C Gram-positive bacteria)]
MGSFSVWHWVVIGVIIVVLFGAKRLPDAARGLGRSMRILKAETKGMMDDDKDEKVIKVETHAVAPAPPATSETQPQSPAAPRDTSI